MSRDDKGFTFIEMIIVVVIIGILASLAVSAYQTYTVRKQITEGLDMASGTRTPIVDAYAQNGIAPAARVDAGMSANATDTAGNFVSSVAIVNGRIDVTFSGPLSHRDIIGKTVSVTPYEAPGNTIIWRCGFAPAPAGIPLNNGDPHREPTVASRYLPSVCRN